MTIDRRTALTLLGTGVTLAVPAMAVAIPSTTMRFDHGIASGDPSADGAILWTRATPEDAATGDVALRWHIADVAGGKSIKSGAATATAARDFTAKVQVTGLKPGRDYWFWFETPADARSPVGRFRTLPVGKVADVVLAAVSCQLYPGGLFNAYDAIAKLDRIDAVLHLGDYIYEYGPDGYGGDIGKKIGRLPEPAHEIVSLTDYRQRHAQVKRDVDMQAAHARAAFICVWDDHEVANDDWIGGAENHDPKTEGDWKTRKAAAMQAYFEWMPIRDPKPGQPWEAINRSFEFGNLATLIMVETRLLARSEQAVAKGEVPEPDDYAPMLAKRADPSREMLGAAQQSWVEKQLTASVAAGKPWQVLGNQVVMARVAGPDIERQLGAERFAGVIARLPELWRKRLASSALSYRAGLPFNFDSWDGYPPARERLYAAFRRAKSRPIILSGDSHAAWANELFDASGTLVAAEFGATAITSPSYGLLLPSIGDLIADANPEVLFCDQVGKGYLLLTLTPETAVGDFRTVSTVYAKPYEQASVKRFALDARGGGSLKALT
jgi:alkaline phosphatase D